MGRPMNRRKHRQYKAAIQLALSREHSNLGVERRGQRIGCVTVDLLELGAVVLVLILRGGADPLLLQGFSRIRVLWPPGLNEHLHLRLFHSLL